MLKRLKLVAFVLLLVAGPSLATVPVADFFKDPEFSNVSLSPTGEYITVSVPQADRTVLAAFRVSDMGLVGKWDFGARRHVDRVRWVNDQRFFMYVSEKLGRYDFRVGTPDVHASNVDGSQRRVIPNGGTYQIVSTLPDEPNQILVSRSVDSAYLFSMDVRDGRISNVASSPLRMGGFVVDHDGNVRYGYGQSRDNESITLRREGNDWVEIHRDAMGGARRIPLMMASDNQRVLFAVSDDGTPARLVLRDPASGDETPVSHNPNVEASDWLVSSDRRELLAVGYMDGLPHYEFVNPDHPESRAYAGLVNAFPEHAVTFHGISRDGRFILMQAFSDIDPGTFYLFDREAGQAKFLLAARDWIKPEQMSPMRPIRFTARDGTTVHGYLTVPNGSSGKGLPLIMHPHGGPHGVRDHWRFNPEVQFLASRGYAVLQVNFRGSGGYGNAFERKGYQAWGTTMVDDMTDAVDWAVAQGIADPQRICTYGASYGGYAALQSIAREPEKYRCTIGYVGVYSLPLMMRDGDIPRHETGRSYLSRVLPDSVGEQQAQSPAFNAERIKVPVMLVHGGRDERVPMSQYRALDRALKEAGNPPEVSIVERNEGHGFWDLDNNIRLYTSIEEFLDKHIGGQ